MYSVNQWSGDDGPPGFKYFKHALRFLPDIHEEGSIFFVDVLCYVAYYMQNLNRRDAAFLYVRRLPNLVTDWLKADGLPDWSCLAYGHLFGAAPGGDGSGHK